ncbi:MAG: hypothetical protein HY279_09985 [Nitrospinae bacterium]|nr:hypothetical protein [Nitrospinota bacterium]
MACHIDKNRFLHEQKYKDFFANEPVNLSGVHRIKANNGRGRCVDCHKGIGILDEMKYLFAGEIFDLIKYLNNPVEPVSLFMPIQDKNCLYCHKNNPPSPPFEKGGQGGFSGYKKINGFHYYNAHKGVIPVRCVECHIAHDNNMNRMNFFINKEKVLNICSKCHRGMSERIRETVGNRQ